MGEMGGGNQNRRAEHTRRKKTQVEDFVIRISYPSRANRIIDLFTDTAAILNSEGIMGCPGGR